MNDELALTGSWQWQVASGKWAATPQDRQRVFYRKNAKRVDAGTMNIKHLAKNQIHNLKMLDADS